MSLTCSLQPINYAHATSQHQSARYYGDGYSVDFTITDSWDGFFNANVVISNTNSQDIDNWSLAFDMPYQITNIWNGEIEDKDENQYLIKNVGSNQDIIAGRSVSFGFTAKKDGELKCPETYDIKSFTEDLDAENTSITYEVTNQYGSGFNGSIKIKNISDQTIEDWSLGFEFPNKISHIWGAAIVENINDYYYIKNDNSNQNINPGETVEIGFSVQEGNSSLFPMSYQVLQVNNKNEIKETLLEPLDSEKGRVEEIEQLYEEESELIEENAHNENNNTTKKIQQIEKKLEDLGVTELSNEEILEKGLNTNNLQSRQYVPSSTSYIKYSSYRYNTVLRGHLYNMQVITSGWTGNTNDRELYKTKLVCKTKSVPYSSGVKASAITVFSMGLSDAIGKIPGGTIEKNLYDICKSGANALSTSTVVNNVKETLTTKSGCYIKEGCLKLAHQSDSFQNKVYVGNKVNFNLVTTTDYSKKLADGTYAPRTNINQTSFSFQSRYYNGISLSTAPGGRSGYDRIFTRNELISSLPFKFAGSNYTHPICSKYYGYMQQYYEY